MGRGEEGMGMGFGWGLGSRSGESIWNGRNETHDIDTTTALRFKVYERIRGCSVRRQRFVFFFHSSRECSHYRSIRFSAQRFFLKSHELYNKDKRPRKK